MTTMTKRQELARRFTVRERDRKAAIEIASGHWSGRRSVVYYVERDGLVKIGTSTQVEQRVKALRGRLLAVEPGGHNRESQLHERFEHLRVMGEWHRPEPDLLDHIATLGSTS